MFWTKELKGLWLISLDLKSPRVEMSSVAVVSCRTSHPQTFLPRTYQPRTFQPCTFQPCAFQPLYILFKITLYKVQGWMSGFEMFIIEIFWDEIPKVETYFSFLGLKSSLLKSSSKQNLNQKQINKYLRPSVWLMRKITWYNLGTQILSARNSYSSIRWRPAGF